ncbi:metal ABC transporter permease, partial [uncultured Veillonella sp.]
GLLTNTNPILGAFIFTAICGALIEFLRKYFSHHLDLILTIILSLSIGTAITLISSGKLKANANVFFFGSILTVNTTDMISIAALTILSVLTLYFLYNSLLYIAYDEEAARVAGVKVDFINYIFAILMAAAVSISIKIVGVLVLSAMIALPVASALQLEKGFRTTLLCSIGFSLLAMIIGLFGSYYLNVAPGGFVSLTSVAILLVVLVIKNIRTILRRMQFSK